MTADPPRRSDGACAQCGGPLRAGPPKTMPKSLRPMFIQELTGDPFCSSTCARGFHGVSLGVTPQQAHRDREQAAA